MNVNYKNYYKRRIVESILSEVVNPGEPSASGQPEAGIGGIIADILKRIRRAPVPVPALPKVPKSIMRLARKNQGIIKLETGRPYKWGYIQGQSGNEYPIVWDNMRQRWLVIFPPRPGFPNGTVEEMPKDFQVPPGFGENGGGQTIPASAGMPGFEGTNDVETPGQIAATDQSQELISTYRQT